MILSSLLLILLAGGVVALVGEKLGAQAPKSIAALTLLASCIAALQLPGSGPAQGPWLAEEIYDWIPRFNIHIHLAVDGIGLLLVWLTLAVGLIAILSQWKERLEHPGFFYLNILWTLAGVIGVFTALDLFLFFVCWEVMLVPVYLLMVVWGHENRREAALKFFLYTQAGGLIMLASILALVLMNYQATGLLTFDYPQLLLHPLTGKAAFLIMLGFMAGFVVKLPAVPFHTWQSDTYSQAPTAASILLAGILSKMGGFGIIRLVLPLFPESVTLIAPMAMAVATFTIVYGAILAFSQQDLKRIIAYSSLSHMGFVMLGCFTLSALGIQGAVMQMMAHGISTAGLLLMAACIEQRYATRDISNLGGVWQVAPRLGAFSFFFIAASMGMPGLGNFIAEFLTLAGAFRFYPFLTLLAATTLVLGAAYSLRIAHKAIFGPLKVKQSTDADGRETLLMLAMAASLIYLGLHPQPVIDLARPVVDDILNLYLPIVSDPTTGVQP